MNTKSSKQRFLIDWSLGFAFFLFLLFFCSCLLICSFAPPPESSPASISNVNHSSQNTLIPATSATEVAVSSITSIDSNKNSLSSWLTWLVGLDPTSQTLSSRLLRGGIFLLLSYCIYKLYQYYQQWKLKIQLIKENIEKKRQEELNIQKQREVMLQQYQHVQEQVKARFEKMQLFMQKTFHISNTKEQHRKDESVTTKTTTTTTTTTTITSHNNSSTPSSNSPSPSSKLLDMVSQSFGEFHVNHRDKLASIRVCFSQHHDCSLLSVVFLGSLASPVLIGCVLSQNRQL